MQLQNSATESNVRVRERRAYPPPPKTPMTADECRQKAEESFAKLATLSNPDHKAGWRKLGEDWLRLAALKDAAKRNERGGSALQ